MIWTTLLVLGLSSLCLATPMSKRWADTEVKHSWAEVPKGWTSQGPAPADHKMVMRIGVKPGNMDELISSLYAVSDPTHPRYGAHLSKEEVEALVAPTPDSLELVNAWLSDHGVDTNDCHRTDGGDWITFPISVADAERMLGTKYHVYNHDTMSSESIVRALSYSLPRTLQGHVDVVTPTTYFGTTRSMKATSFLQPGRVVAETSEDRISTGPGSLVTVPSSCSSTITPTCIRDLYNSSTYVPAATATNKLGIAGYLAEYASTSDFTSFLKKYRTDASTSYTFSVTLVNGGKNTQNDPGVEANLDVQYAGGISYPTPNIYYSTGGSPPYTPDSNEPSNTNEPYLDWLNYILAQSSVPQTFSTSYGDDEQTVPLDYATSVCNLFAQLGARGASILFSSGDDGVGAGNCQSNDGTKKVKFQPDFPASCPYVTTVGGTTRINPEVAASFSGGGFSNYFGTPSYQTTVVKSYIAGFSSYSTYYNASGRAYPDVAAQAENFAVVVSGGTESVAGTSCSSPTFAGIVSLLNDYRISLGKAPLGFLNPLIYSTLSSGFNDITSGTNAGCGTNGFTAKAGWDPVTGWGTPNFGKLQALIQNI